LSDLTISRFCIVIIVVGTLIKHIFFRFRLLRFFLVITLFFANGCVAQSIHMLQEPQGVANVDTLNSTLADLESKLENVIASRCLKFNSNLNSIANTYQNVIWISKQAGKTNKEKLFNAIAKAKANDIIYGDPSLVVDLKGDQLVIPSGVRLQGNRATITSSLPLKSLLTSKTNASNININSLILDGAGNESGAAVLLSGIHNVAIENNTFINNAQSAISIRSSHNRQAKDITINGNYIHSPTKGIGHTVLVASKTDGAIVECVSVTNNTVYGSQPSNPRLADYEKANEFSADQITLQGVKYFRVSGNYSGWSGSSGYTISRLSEYGIVSNNIAEMCFEPGYNFGSGFEAIQLGEMSNIKVGDVITNGKAQMLVKAIMPSGLASDRIWYRGNVSKNSFSVGDIIWQKTSSNSINQLVEFEVLDVLHASQRIIVRDNQSIETGIQGNKGKSLGSYNTIRSKDLVFHQNRHSNPKSIGLTDKVISLSLSQAILSSNYPSYASNPEKYQISGPGAKTMNFSEVLK